MLLCDRDLIELLLEMAASECKTYLVIFHYFNQVQRNVPHVSSRRDLFLLQVTINTSLGLSVLFLDLYFDILDFFVLT